jgi:ATP-dependent helicase/DNAse subunit B
MSERIFISAKPGSDFIGRTINMVLQTIELKGMDSFIFIAPDLDFMDRIRICLIDKGNISAINDSCFKTFQDFASDFLPGHRIAPVSLRRLFLKSILYEDKFQLQQECRLPGFRRRVEQLFREVDQLSPEKQDKIIKSLKAEFKDGVSGNGIVGKIADCYLEFGKILEKHGYDTRESILYKSTSGIQSKINNKTIIISGFHWFEDSELELIRAIAQTNCDIFLIVPCDDNPAIDPMPETMESLRKAGFRIENLDKKQDSTPEILQRLTNSKRDEADFIAHKTADLLKKGFKPDEILIFHPSPHKAVSHLESAFHHISIPFKTSIPGTLREISPVLEVLSLLELFNGNLEKSLSLGYSRFSEPVHDIILALDDDMLISLREGKSVPMPGHINPGSWKDFIHIFNKAGSVRDIRGFVLLIDEIKSRLLKLPSIFPDDPSKITAIAWRTFKKILSNLEDFYQNQITSDKGFYLNHFTGELRDQVEVTLVRPRDSRKEAVELVSFENSLLKTAKVVFLAGMNNDQFPVRSLPDPILGENARNELSSRGYNLRTRRNDLTEDRLFLNHILNLATDKLIISAPVQDEKGEPLEVSAVLYELFPNGWEHVREDDREIFTYDDLLVQTGEIDEISSTELKEILEIEYRRGLRILNTQVSTNEDLNAALFNLKKLQPFSATALGNYARCPFIYFAQNLLKLPGAETSLEKAITPLTRGTAFHEYLSLKICGNAKDINLYEILHKNDIDPEKMDFIEEANFLQYVSTLERFINFELERIAAENRKVIDTESIFGLNDKPALILNFGNISREFSGKIDRIDTLKDNSFAVIDYKISSKSVSRLFEEALKFQLPLYVLALKENGREPSQAEIIAISRRDWKSERSDKLNEEPERTIEWLLTTGKENIRNAVDGVDNGRFHAEPIDDEFCGWDKCGYYHMCRIKR